MTREYTFHTLDVFTDRIFGGNPLAVLTAAEGLDAEHMVRITREFNLSETVFVLPPDDPKHAARVRIFTPGRELPFAGHPTVGTAFLLASLGAFPLTEGETRIVLEEGVGPVPVTIRVRDGAPVSAELTAAQEPTFRDEVPSVREIARMLSLSDGDVLTLPTPPRAVSCGVPFLLVPLRDQDAVSRAKADRAVWDAVLREGVWAREVYLFDGGAAARRETIRARMFAPSLGIAEDPATGSAACCLAAYLAAAAPVTDGELRWTIEQGVEMGRTSTLHISAEKRENVIAAVRVAGESVRVSQGTLTVPG
jgi:trans-2,3-dihydro-3-hydroxyanthranilate isomerase